MRECPRIVLSGGLVRYARNFVDKSRSTTLTRELASLAGSLFFFGGRSNYYIGRAMFSSVYDFGGMNVRHFGVQIEYLGDVEKATVKVPGSERREGWIYVAVALSPVVNEGTENEKAVALIYGYVVEKDLKDNPKELTINFMQTTALPPFAHKGVTNERAKIFWPSSSLSRPWGTKRNEEKPVGGSGTTRTDKKDG